MQTCYNNTAEYGIKELSALMSTPQTTLRDWEKLFSIPVKRNDFGQRIYTENILTVFKEIKKYKAKGLGQEDIKNKIELELKSCGNTAERIEVLTDSVPEQELNYNLMIKPYTERITTLETKTNKLTERTIVLERDNATLTERLKNKDEIIFMLQQQKQEAESRLNKSWLKILFGKLI
jgi:DNA-binding transcriptional MerR regulator